uniref:Josephin-2 isoform X2 n=1 Tax=Phascolarctos cinereus TaxID=38626 RepID=A0A6P5IZS4_PHACI|nr:josephin-2 isoform X2 [Phascolarctos cinereus]
MRSSPNLSFSLPPQKHSLTCPLSPPHGLRQELPWGLAARQGWLDREGRRPFVTFLFFSACLAPWDICLGPWTKSLVNKEEDKEDTTQSPHFMEGKTPAIWDTVGASRSPAPCHPAAQDPFLAKDLPGCSSDLPMKSNYNDYGIIGQTGRLEDHEIHKDRPPFQRRIEAAAHSGQRRWTLGSDRPGLDCTYGPCTRRVVMGAFC